MQFHFHANQIHFHKNGFALRLALKQRHKRTRKWPIGYPSTFLVIYQKLVLRVSSGVPNTEKVMKARGRRPSAFIVSRCLEPLMKHEARVFDMASQMKQ